MFGMTPEQTLPFIAFLVVMIGCPIAAILVARRDRRQQARTTMNSKREAVSTKWETRPTGRRARPSLITSSVHDKHMRDSRPDHRVGNNPPTSLL